MSKVYVARATETGLVKIGMSSAPKSRIRDVAYSSGFAVDLVHVVSCGRKAKAVERAAHSALADARRVGEWFDVTVEAAISAVHAADGTTDEPPDKQSVGKLAGGMLGVRLSSEEIRMLDELRRPLRDIPNRSEMLRRLLRATYQHEAAQ